jgi:DNA-binding transcriptional MerR regulator
MMTIGLFSEKTGLRPKTLRYYEEVNLLVPTVRTANGYRQYEVDQVETALLIHSLRQASSAHLVIKIWSLFDSNI